MPTPMQPWDLFMVRIPARHPADAPIHAGAPNPDRGDSAYRHIIGAASRHQSLGQAIRVSTPSLAAVLDGPATEASLTTAQARRAALSLLKYDLRMRTRPTPFGLFAGVSVGHYDQSVSIRVAAPPRARILPDMAWLTPIVQRLQLHPEILQHLKVQTNTPSVVRGDRIHIDPPTTTKPGDLAPTTVRVRATPAITDVLETAADPIPVRSLIESIPQRHGGQPEAVLRLIRGLCERDLLLTDLRPQLDGVDPLTYVTNRLRFIDDSSPLDPQARRDIDGLKRVEQLRDQAEAAPHDDTEAFAQLLGAARDVHDHDTPLHVDLGMATEVTLPTSVAEDAAHAVELMRQLAPARLGMRSLRRWHADFVERYGVDRLVPVLDVLDPAAGLGAPAGYEWPTSESADTDGPRDDTSLRRDRILADLVAKAHRRQLREVVLDEHVLAALSTNPEPEHTQASCELYCLLAADSLDAVNNGSYAIVVAPNPGSHQAGATFGRFTGLFDGQTRSELKDAANTECAAVATAWTVSLAYQPRSPKAANIAHAPIVTTHRIGVGLMTPDHLPGESNIPLNDLAIGATLDRLYLLHLPTGREIVPAAQTMLSPGTQAPNVARLLFEIGMEGQRLWEPWDWGAAGAAPYLPRVRVGRIILCPATWKLDTVRDAAQAAAGDSAAVIDAAIDRWRTDWDIPDKVVALSSDQRLTLDLTDPWHRLLLWTETRRDPNLVVQECPGGFTHDWFGAAELPPRPMELVIPMSRAPYVPKQRQAREVHAPTTVDAVRRHAPGADWIYVHLNTPLSLQNEVLRQHLPSLLADLDAAGADAWFYLRYSIPQPHLRLRWHLQPEADLAKALVVLSETLEQWHTHRLVGDWTLDTYEPEWERYGGPQLQRHVEQAFHADSVACLHSLILLAEPSVSFTDDEAAAASMAAVAHAFGAPAPNTAWVDHNQAASDPAAAWLARTGLPRDVPTVVRQRRTHWQQLIDPASNWQHLRSSDHGQLLMNALDGRASAVRDYADALRASIIGQRQSVAEVRAVGSLMHMSFNRLIGGPPEREQAALAAARMATTAHWERRKHRQ